MNVQPQRTTTTRRSPEGSRTRPQPSGMPPPLTGQSLKVLVKAVFMELPENHTWIFMKGKSFRD